MITRRLPRLFKGFRYFGSSLPVWEKPYNPQKYEVLSDEVKQATGYAFLDVEPMPRARIMKLGYLILDKVKEIPAEENARLWYEEKAKWLMELTDETESIKELEKKLGDDIIEDYIQDLHEEYKFLIQLIATKAYIDDGEVTKEEEAEFEYMNAPRLHNKYGHFGREHRKELDFLEAQADLLDAGNKLE